MFGPKVLEVHNSPFGGQIKLMQGFGYKYVSTGILTQSGGIVADVWRPVLKKVAQKNKSWLILGLGAGTVAELISKSFSPSKLVGVEIDPVMLDLGRRHFNLEKITPLQIVEGNANISKNWKLPKGEKYDFLLVDMYLGDRLPDFVYSEKFLGNLNKSGNTVVFNHLFYDAEKKSAAQNLVSKAEKIFPKLTLIRSLTNLLIIAQN